jgi:hypothetical protein
MNSFLALKIKKTTQTKELFISYHHPVIDKGMLFMRTVTLIILPLHFPQSNGTQITNLKQLTSSASFPSLSYKTDDPHFHL